MAPAVCIKRPFCALHPADDFVRAGDSPAQVARLLRVSRATFYRHFPASQRGLA